MRSPSTGMLGDFSSALFHVGRPGIALPGHTGPVGGLRMVPEYTHTPAMVDEVVAQFALVPAGVVVDGTVGGGGHAAAVLAACPELGLLGLDRDPEALTAARRRLAAFGPRVALRHATFGAMASEVDAARAAGGRAWPTSPGEDAGAGERITGVLLDLGVSSWQLDEARRGFSYRLAGPLDMRMDASGGTTAADLVNGATVDELAAVLAANGEARLARRLARAIVAARPLTTTDQLAAVVSAAVPAPGRRRGHPARRVFQALRVTVNDELEQLGAGLVAGLGLLAPGGRMAVIAYHSGEDRLVKAAFGAAVRGGCTCPPGLPCVCGARPTHRLAWAGTRRPSPAEVERNHRVESARLRVIVRLEDG